MAYITNRHGIVHTIPDDWEIPEGCKKANKTEIGAYEQRKAETQAANLTRLQETRRREAHIVTVVNEVQDVDKKDDSGKSA